MPDKMIMNMWKTKAVRASCIKEVRWFKGEDETSHKPVWIVYGSYGEVDGLSGGFTFGKFDKDTEAKEFVEKIVKDLEV